MTTKTLLTIFVFILVASSSTSTEPARVPLQKPPTSPGWRREMKQDERYKSKTTYDKRAGQVLGQKFKDQNKK
jgi:hypothetical protein